MADRMTTHERLTRIYAHQEADRVPIRESPWGSTLERWRREGLPEGVNWADYLGLDKTAYLHADNSPRYPRQVIERTEEYTVETTGFGVTLKNWRHSGGVPQFLDFTVVDPDTWAKAKERMVPSRDRIDWATLERDYKSWRGESAWITAGFWFGFDVTHSWMVGTERVLMALVEQPEWVKDMIDTMVELDIALYDMVWEAGYTFDEIRWPDDLGYKNNQFMSPAMYRAIVKPAHQRAAEWAHAKGVKVALHSCGDVNPFIPDFLDAGIDMLNPLEVKAGMDPLGLKARYGDRLAFHGGLNAVLYEHPEELWAEMRRVIPGMKAGGGYVISSDHSVPDSVSWDEFRQFVVLAKELGAYA
ncbi:MAG: uroporphyrinogen decarboxylase family protein [Anaerolineae bacterium]